MRRIRWHLGVMTCMVGLVLSQQVTGAGPHPNIFLNQHEIEAIGAKVRAGEEPWKTAYVHLLADANRALDQPPVSVTWQGDSGHFYRTEPSYCGWKKVDGKHPDCRDGRINPQADRGDYMAAITLGRAVRNLGLAYAFTGTPQYAQKALELIHVWNRSRCHQDDPTVYQRAIQD